ncbi:MAG: hypothetical protein K6F33_04730 [Bacteroidales bacterium]|nr:hypothetical protein [Bacteroidales bacterium]
MKQLFVLILVLASMAASAQKDNAETLKEAMALQSQGQLTQSNQKLTDLYALRYMTDYVSWQLATNYYNIGNYKKAERFANEAMTEGSHYVLQAGIIKAMSLGMRNKPDQELQLLQRLAEHFPNEASSHFSLGICLWNNNQTQSANAELHKAILLDKANPSMHLRIAYINNAQQLYIQAFLAYYTYLFTNPVTYGKQTIITLSEIMNQRNVNPIIDIKTANDALLTKEDNDLIWAMLFLKELKTCETDSESGLPDVDNFVDNSRKLIKSVCESIEEKQGFYEEFYVNFFQKLLKDNMLDAFLYYCLIDTYQDDLNSAIPGISKEKMESFADWLEVNFN